MLKIIGGEFRTRTLVGPAPDEASRPYTARVRESVFNLLRGWFDDASVLDLFAGVGTVGLEAISQGASHVVMVERARSTHAKLVENIELLGCDDRAVAVHGDALGSACLLRARRPVDVVFVDPPYAMMRDEDDRRRVIDQIVNCRAIMAERSWLILRTPDEPKGDDGVIEGFEGPEVHAYAKDMFVCLYMPRRDAEIESDP